MLTSFNISGAKKQLATNATVPRGATNEAGAKAYLSVRGLLT